MLDYLLALGHHLIVFALFAVLVVELMLVKPGLNAAQLQRIASVDSIYGILAIAILVLGFARANLAAKGWDYYSHNTFFWLKIGTFALVGLLSVPPTFAFIAWRKRLRLDAHDLPSDAQVKRIRMLLHIEATLFIPILAFAAAMARGYGQLN